MKFSRVVTNLWIYLCFFITVNLPCKFICKLTTKYTQLLKLLTETPSFKSIEEDKVAVRFKGGRSLEEILPEAAIMKI